MKQLNAIPSSTYSYFLSSVEIDAFTQVKISIRDAVAKNPSNPVPDIFFMDDDLLDWRILKNIPLLYGFRLWKKVIRHRPRILLNTSEVWVSTPYLANKYKNIKPRLLRPVIYGEMLNRLWLDSSTYPDLNESSFNVRICYHGTWSHRDDMKWLAPVIAEVQSRCSNTIFEVIGGDRVARIFKGIPRVSVLPTMPWSDYLKHTQTVHQDIGLAPLRDTMFNRGRGPIKFFDYARAGAVGIYSAGPAFSGFVANGIDGFVLENNHAAWIDKIVELVNAPQLRQRMADAAWSKVLDNSPSSPEIQTYLQDLNNALTTLSFRS